MTSPTLSVIVPMHDNAPTIGAQLEALLARPVPGMEIVVVDNRSSDDSRTVAGAFANRGVEVRIVDAPELSHAAYARGVGVGAARSDHLAFCDGDDVVADTWARAMAAGLQTAEFVTGPVELDRLNPPWLAGVRGRALFDRRALLYDTVPFAHGCNFGVRRELLERVGTFASDVPLASEDVEFAIRAWRAGVSLEWCPDAVVHYRIRPETGRRWRQAIVYGRTQRTIRRLLPDLAVRSNELERTLRRIVWLIARSPFTYRRDLRARWIWTLGLVVGDAAEYVPGLRRWP